MLPYSPPLGRALARGLTRRCARCGSGNLFRHWVAMVDDCPRCGLHFEAAPGYWLGSMTFNLGFTLIAFIAVLVGAMAAMWPDVNYGWLFVLVVAVSALVPVLVHPVSRTLWVALERYAHNKTGTAR
jgi:uncharacterized protein (DUF983 family)